MEFYLNCFPTKQYKGGGKLDYYQKNIQQELAYDYVALMQKIRE